LGIITCLLSTLAEVDAIVAAYAKVATYRTPRVDHDLTGQAIGYFAQSVWTVFPDASLEVISIGDAGGGLVAILRTLTYTDRVRGATRINLFGDNAKFFAKMLPEHHRVDI
jgi:hypothetical protein